MEENNRTPTRKDAEIGQTYFILGFVFIIIGLTNFIFLPIGIVFLVLALTMYPDSNPFAAKKKPEPEQPVVLKKPEEPSDHPTA